MITSLWTLVLKMRLSVLVFMVFITAVYSAAMREAFHRNSPEPAVVTVSDPSNAAGVSEPIAVCSTSTPMDNPAELLRVSPETDSVEYPDTAEEKSKENSKSADQTDEYDHRSSKKRNSLPENLGTDNNSAESKSAERTYMDKYVKTEKRPSKTEENKSSQEMYGHWASVTDQEKKKRKNTKRQREEHRVTQIPEIEATKMNAYLPKQPQTKERNRKDKTETKRENGDSILLRDSQNIIDQSQECVELSSWMMGYPDGETASVGGAGVDRQSDEGITNSEPQPRKLCAARKRMRTLRTRREHLDTDSAERVNSELLDKDNSSERIPAQLLPGF